MASLFLSSIGWEQQAWTSVSTSQSSLSTNKKPLVYFPFIANETKVTASDDWRNLALDVWKRITKGIIHGQSSLAKRNHWHNIVTEISGVSTQLGFFTFTQAFRTILNQRSMKADHWIDGKFFKRHRITQIQSSLSWLPSTAWPSVFVCCKGCLIRRCFNSLKQVR